MSKTDAKRHIYVNDADCVPLEDGYLTLKYKNTGGELRAGKVSKNTVKQARMYESLEYPLSVVMRFFAISGLFLAIVNLTNLVGILAGKRTEELVAPISMLILLVVAAGVFGVLLLLYTKFDRSHDEVRYSVSVPLFVDNRAEKSKSQRVSRFLPQGEGNILVLRLSSMLEHLTAEDLSSLYEGSAEHDRTLEALLSCMRVKDDIDRGEDPDLYDEASAKVEEYGQKVKNSYQERVEHLKLLRGIVTENTLTSIQEEEYSDR